MTVTGAQDPSTARASRRATPPETERRLRKLPLAVVGMLVVAFLVVPIIVVVPMSFSSANSLAFPPPGFSLRWYRAFFDDPSWLSAAYTSFIVAIAASLAALLLGSLASYGLVRGRFRGRALLTGNFLAPMIIPTIVSAVALYISFAQIGLLGDIYGLILAHTLLAVPYVLLVMTVAIESFDARLEHAARTLGAPWRTVFLRIMLPNLLPSVVAAWIFAFVFSFDEVIVTLFISGTNMTIPKKMFNELVLQVNPTITAIATLLIAFNVVTVVVFALIMRRRRESRRTRLGAALDPYR